MKKDQVKNARRLSEMFRVDDGDKFRLKDVDPADTGPFKSKEEVKGLLQQGVEALAALQEKIYAQDRWALLLIFQAMDAAGKDSTIEHVMSGVNPQGVDVSSFKAPSAVELDHDFLWRTTRCLPERGRIGIFNRSYYEEVLVVRVHPEILQAQRLPDACRGKDVFEERFEDIRGFERYLCRNGVMVRKFFLHVSKAEQRRRFLARLERPEKNWKFSTADLKERGYWKDYMRVYEDAIRRTATKHAPWYVIPADHKWFTRLVVAAAIITTLEELDLHFPKVDKAKRRELRDVRAELLRERD
ncbi:MAG TPA: polyphosphate kinase 2 family protein [Candidatus Polarisedimenticolia bacterium]|nr:polyphosphate kinase 2 family protein [Candidatus Polarisedimenticolia bacterium]